jgi:hypothetical protein
MWQHAPKYLQRFLARYPLEGCLCCRNFFPTPPRPGRYHSARAWTASSTVASAPATAPLGRHSCRKRRPWDSPTSKPPRPRSGGLFSCADLDRDLTGRYWMPSASVIWKGDDGEFRPGGWRVTWTSFNRRSASASSVMTASARWRTRMCRPCKTPANCSAALSRRECRR